MSTQVQYRRGTGAQNDAFVGALAEITVDTTAKTLRVHDGATAGGSNIATVAYVDNAISSLSANSISDGTSSLAIIATNGNIRANVAGSTISTIYSSGLAVTGLISATGNVTGGNVTTAGIVSAATLTGTLSTAAQTNITSVGTLGSLTVTGNISSGNTSGTTATFTTFSGSGASLTNLNGSNIASGTVPTARISGSYTGITGTGALAAGSITSGFGSIDIGTDTVTCGGIVNANANGAGNIGSSTTYFNTVFAKATSAQYADVAEKYLADVDYEPGTVVEIGGSAEVVQTTSENSTRIAGVVSTDPAFIMNSGQAGQYSIPVALLGRVPCKVVGQIHKGDLLCSSSTPGHAAVLVPGSYQPGCVIGKALEDHPGLGTGVIEVLVGRL